ncbi:PaREP1 domain protein [Acidianus hospitalis W1]|uniref:PaREP1 domain protein n=1 Tax=Acidianus hospitalis (strain W1) TaxID=933801 RepID=F4B6I3_ACIHW|nr:PaREP1 family protein [Acidianus hospitalis]AEE94603.1 PaREP1 domain protein [Acidianus hospitalis W1]
MEELIKKAEEKGIDVEDLIISAMSKEDPQGGIKLRLELAKKYMAEAEEYLKKGDAVQASEKAYKVAEEIVKALSEKFNLQEYQQAVKEGRWYTLGSAVSSLSKKLGNWIVNGWSSAYFLYVWGFHESKLSTDDIIPYLDEVKRMLEEAEKVLNAYESMHTTFT